MSQINVMHWENVHLSLGIGILLLVFQLEMCTQLSDILHFDQVWIYVMISYCYKKEESLIKNESYIYFPVDRHLFRTQGLYLFVNLAVRGLFFRLNDFNNHGSWPVGCL